MWPSLFNVNNLDLLAPNVGVRHDDRNVELIGNLEEPIAREFFLTELGGTDEISQASWEKVFQVGRVVGSHVDSWFHAWG
jgi:hypothetical protein